MKLLGWWPVEKALYVACALGLVTLGIMSAGVIIQTPLWVIGAMSAAQGLGTVAGLMFVISVAADAGRKR
jgi:hypothetical protein